MRLRTMILALATGCLLSPALSRAEKSGGLFTENKGQFTDDKNKPVDFVLFRSSNPGSDLWITDKGITYVFKQVHVTGTSQKKPSLADAKPVKVSVNWSRVDMELVGADINRKEIAVAEQLEGELNYYSGNKAIKGVNEYRQVTVKNVYPGIDWVIRASEKGIKYDFVVHAGGDISAIKLKYNRCASELDTKGALHISTPEGGMIEDAPEVFYENGKAIGSRFKLQNNVISFGIDSYDKSKTIIIDPLQHLWATYYGGADYDNVFGLDVDAANNVFMAGTTYSMDFPTQDPGGVYFDGVIDGFADSYVVKFDNAGTRLWATYYGGTSDEETRSLHVDNNGNVWLVGSTFSTDMPLAAPAGAYIDSTYNGESTGPYNYWGDGFISKFTNSGSLVWSTYYGGDSTDLASGIKSDAIGNIYICGITGSPDFPTQMLAGAYNDTTYNGGLFDAYVLKFTNSGTRLWAAYYGGSDIDFCESIVAQPNGEIYVCGETVSPDLPVQNLAGAYNQASLGAGIGSQNGYVLNFNTTGALNWATYYGDLEELFYSMNASGNKLTVVGYSGSTAYPVQDPGNGAYFQPALGGNIDAVITEFDLGTHAVTWSTYFGGLAPEAAYTLDWDAFGNLIIGGEVDSAGLILQNFTGGYNDSTFGDGGADGFLAGFDNNRGLFWSTFYYGDGYDYVNNVIIDSNDELLVAGETNSSDSPLQNSAGAYYQSSMNGISDAHIARFGAISTVGVNEIVPGNDLNIYPNPNDGLFWIDANGMKGDVVADVFSADGRCILSQALAGNSRIKLDLTNQAKGIYLVRLYNGTTSAHSRVVIQ